MNAAIAQLVELLPSKQKVAGSTPARRSTHRYPSGPRARIANPVFAGSNPARCSISDRHAVKHQGAPASLPCGNAFPLVSRGGSFFTNRSNHAHEKNTTH